MQNWVTHYSFFSSDIVVHKVRRIATEALASRPWWCQHRAAGSSEIRPANIAVISSYLCHLFRLYVVFSWAYSQTFLSDSLLWRDFFVTMQNPIIDSHLQTLQLWENQGKSYSLWIQKVGFMVLVTYRRSIGKRNTSRNYFWARPGQHCHGWPGFSSTWLFFLLPRRAWTSLPQMARL
jgi:hypothetical protein